MRITPWRFAIGAVGAVMIAMPARAQAPVPFAWSGFYVGVQGGYGFGQADHYFLAAADNGLFAPKTGGGFVQSLDGGTFGGHLGFNQQVGNLLVGLEGSFSWNLANGSTRNPFAPGVPSPVSYETDLEWLATLTPRLGLVAGPWLFYGKGGLVVGQARSTLVSTALGATKVFEEANGYLGWTAGIGVEYALGGNWIVGIEYNFHQLGAQPYGGSGVPRNAGGLGFVEYGLDLQFSTALARLSYRLGTAPTGAAPAGAAGRSAYDWTGFYVGVHAGYGWGEADHLFVPFGNSGSFAPTPGGGSFSQDHEGGLLGGHGGFNYQRDRLVIGLEGTFTLNRFGARSFDPMGRVAVGFERLIYDSSMDGFATMTPRIGFAADSWLIFAKGGVAAGRIGSTLINTTELSDPLVFQEQSWHVGWTLGGGVEYAFAPNWSLGVEYNYYDLGSERYGNYGKQRGRPVVNVDYAVDVRFSAAMARLSYRFGAPPP
jgi:outer membrane immunogenic protein